MRRRCGARTIRTADPEPPGEDEWLVEDLVGCRIEGIGEVTRVLEGMSCDVLEAGGELIPLVTDAVTARRRGEPGHRGRSRVPRAVKIDVFTLFPDWFDFFTGQRHVQNAIAGGLEFGAVSYRDTTPLTGGQVDDTPYGGGAGMVIRVDVVEAALEARYGGDAADLGERATRDRLRRRRVGSSTTRSPTSWLRSPR